MGKGKWLTCLLRVHRGSPGAKPGVRDLPRFAQLGRLVRTNREKTFSDCDGEVSPSWCLIFKGAITGVFEMTTAAPTDGAEAEIANTENEPFFLGSARLHKLLADRDHRERMEKLFATFCDRVAANDLPAKPLGPCYHPRLVQQGAPGPLGQPDMWPASAEEKIVRWRNL